MSVNVGTAVGYLDLDTSKFKNALKDAQSQLSSFSDKSLSAGEKFTNLGSGLKSIGSTLSTSVTLPLVGIGTAAVATAATFEKSMDNVAALSGATGKDLEDLTNLAKKMGETTQFSASEAADALGYMALAGWDTNQSMNGLPGILDLAASSGMGLAEASDMVTDYLSAFGEEADQAGRMADVLAKAQASSNTTAQGLGEAFKNCAVNANAFGLDIEQTTAVLGKLADQGLKGSEAGTALNAVFRDMSSKMKDGAIAIGDTNVKITDAKGNFRSLADIVTDVEKATDGLSESEKMVALQSTFTADSIKAMGILMNTGGDSINDFTNELYGAEGAASKMASAMNDNLSGQLTLLKSALEGAAISIGEALMPMIKGLVAGINELVNWFNSLNPSIQQTIIVIAGIVAAIGPVLIIIGQMSIGIGSLITFFGAAKVAIIAFGTMLKTNLMAHLISFNVYLSTTVIPALTAFGTFITGTVIPAITSFATSIVSTVISALTSFVTMLSGMVMSAISAVASFLTGVLIPTLTATAFSIGAVTVPVWAVIAAFAALVAAGVLVYKNWDTIKAKCIEIWQNSIKPTIEKVTNTISAFLQATWTGIQAFLSTCWNLLSQLASTVWNAISSIISTAVNVISSVIKSVFNAITSFIQTVLNGWKNIIQTVWNGIQSVVSTYVNAVRSVIQSVFNAVSNIISATSNGWKATLQAVWGGIKSIVSTGVNAVKSTISNVWSGLQSLLVAPFNAAKGVIDSILSGISSAISGVKNAISSVKSAASNVIDKFNPFRSITIPQDDIQTYDLYRDISQAQRLVYSNELAKTSIAESIKNVTSSARSMTGTNSNKSKEYPSKNITINNTYNSPKPASIRELKKQDEIQMRRLAMQF